MPFRYIILLLISALPFGTGIQMAFAQTKKIDSLKLLLTNAKEDTSKLNILNNLSFLLYQGGDNENSLLFAGEQLELARRLGLRKAEAYALVNIGNNNVDQNKLERAFAFYQSAALIGKQIGDKTLIGITYANFGNIESLKGNYRLAGEKLDTALDIYREIGDKMHIAHTLANLGMNYYDQNNYADAIQQLYMAIRYFEETGDEFMLGNCHYYLGNIKLDQKNYADALSEYDKSIAINTKLYRESNEPSGYEGAAALSICRTGEIYLLNGKPDIALAKFNDALKKINSVKFSESLKGGRSMCYMGIGKIFELRGDAAKSSGDTQTARQFYLSAQVNYEKSLNQNIEEGYGKKNFENDMPKIYNLLGNIDIKLDNFYQGQKWLTRALQLSFEKKARPQIRDSYFNLSIFYERSGNTGEAYNNYKKYIAYRDSIVNEESLSKAEGFKKEYEFSKKEDSLKSVQIVTETKLQTEKKQRYYYWAGISLLAMLSFLIFLNFRNQKKINRLAAAAYAKERTELELQSLRAQLNPHFIFNCINSIDAFIHSNDKYNATVYLNKFARLLRNILDSSKFTSVSFAKDIDTLKLYVELEELRHENKFSTEFRIDNELLNNDYKVPALIVQPFVENAILHGLKNREDNNGLLQIDIKKVADTIEYAIKDNGIGRKAAGLIAQNKESSYGMQMSSDRIKLFNREDKPSVEITDLYDGGIAAGTAVKVHLKLI